MITGTQTVLPIRVPTVPIKIITANAPQVTVLSNNI
jgi:hypothetical protein